jgi:hypothetical protein
MSTSRWHPTLDPMLGKADPALQTGLRQDYTQDKRATLRLARLHGTTAQ